MDLKYKAVGILEDTAEEHVYQLNHMYVRSPGAGREVMYADRLFVVFDCWDFPKKIQIFFRKNKSLSRSARTLAFGRVRV